MKWCAFRYIKIFSIVIETYGLVFDLTLEVFLEGRFECLREDSLASRDLLKLSKGSASGSGLGSLVKLKLAGIFEDGRAKTAGCGEC